MRRSERLQELGATWKRIDEEIRDAQERRRKVSLAIMGEIHNSSEKGKERNDG